MATTKSVCIVFTFLLCGFLVTTDESVDNYITLCLENFSEVMRTGDPVLGIPILDPFQINNIQLEDLNSHHMKLSANASDILIQNMSYYIPTYVHVEFNNLTIYISLNLDEILINGTYWCDGMYQFVFPVFGDGPFHMEVYDIVNGGNGGIYITDDDYLQITFLNMTIIFDRLNVYFSNFLGGGDFGDQVNEALSVLGKLYFDAMLPWMQEAVVPAMVTYINSLLMQHTLTEIILGALPGPPV